MTRYYLLLGTAILLTLMNVTTMIYSIVVLNERTERLDSRQHELERYEIELSVWEEGGCK